MENNRGLSDLIDVTLLQDIQDKLAEITGLAFNIVNFRGDPINKYSNFCSFCKAIRDTDEGFKLCRSANAHGGLEAAIRQKPYMFKCPAGLVDVAIPIIIDNQYVGAIFFGQVRTNAEDYLLSKESKNISRLLKKYPDFKKYYNDIGYIDYNKIKAIYSLVETIINQLINKSSLNKLEEEIIFNNIKLKKKEEENNILKSNLESMNFKFFQIPININVQLSILNSISNLALIEDAPKTQEMICTLAEIIRYSSKNINNQVILEEEIKNVNNYLKIQSAIFSNTVKYKINLDDKIKKIKIIPMTLLSVIEYLFLNSKILKNQRVISITGNNKEKYAIITIEDNGVNIEENKLFLIMNNKKEHNDSSLNISFINKLFNNYYGNEYKIKVTNKENIGTIIEMKLPLVYEK
ncbi:PocR ligand-binding domain-containing protein [Clostridium septicum]|uniref:PocR ligand-binding domain-containing protein n=1 Tax=Clostridium septicum TaxID=1504 RepID=UPI00082C90BF|nr:PocR ligand-binding domain-containing protein [Clostridium septicum]